MDDGDLVTRARSGDADAFGELVARNRDAANRVAVRMGAGSDADDVVQEAFVKAYRRLPSYRGESSFRAWLLAIVANETLNLHRSRRRHEEAGVRAALVAPGPDETDVSFESSRAAHERRELIAAMRGLSDGDRDVIAYRFLLDRSEAETAALLDWPVGTVKSRTSRALAKLRTRLGAAIAIGVAVAAIVAVPPARTAVAHAISAVLRFAGVEVRPAGAGPTSDPTSAPGLPLPSTRAVALDEARRLAPFPIGLPTALGPPEQVWLSDPDPTGAPRVVSLLFAGGVRIDEFDGSLDMTFVKASNDVNWVTVAGSPALWLDGPHSLTYVDGTGTVRPATARIANATLIWQRGPVGYRIEGAGTPAAAIAIAESLTP